MANLIQLENEPTFTTRMGDDNGLFDAKIPRIGEADADIRIGGDDSSKFQSEIQTSKWDGEYFLNIRNPLMPLRSDVKSFDRGIITIEDTTKGIQERYFSTKQKNPSLEYEMIFASQPPSEIRLNIEYSPGMTFSRQDVKDFIPGSIYEPNIPGSFVVYIPESNNAKRTGKFCHSYKPEWVDKVGRRCFVEDFWIDNGQIVIVSGDWVETAIYPIVLDPIIGWDSIGGIKYGLLEWFVITLFNTTTDASGGNISTFHWYIHDDYDGINDGKAAVYDGNATGANRISGSVTLAAGNQVAGWNVFAMTGSMAALTDYYPAIAWSGGPPGMVYDLVAASHGHDNTIVWGDEMTNPMAANPQLNGQSKMSIYVTYIPVAGGVVPLINAGLINRGLVNGGLIN